MASHPGFLLRALGWLLAAIASLCRASLVAWPSLALYYALPRASLRPAAAVAFVAFGIWALWLARRPRSYLAFAILFLGVLAWFSSIRPSHDRAWRPEVATMPRAIIDGDHVRITGVRDFDYRSRDDFTVRYEEREVALSHLTAVDFFVSYWTPGPVGHTFRQLRLRQRASPLHLDRNEAGGRRILRASRLALQTVRVDLCRRRRARHRACSHQFRDEDVYLYRIRIAPENARRLLRIYLARINELADQPEFYHLLSNSCTINIVRYANVAGRVGAWNVRHILNGLIDRYLYSRGHSTRLCRSRSCAGALRSTRRHGPPTRILISPGAFAHRYPRFRLDVASPAASIQGPHARGRRGSAVRRHRVTSRPPPRGKSIAALVPLTT